MAGIELKDVIQCIPVYSGKSEEFDAFINTCDMMNTIIAAANKPVLLSIIKAKITGEALAKIRPIGTLNTWAELKKRLKERLRRPLTFEYAQADLSNVAQKQNEPLEDFAKRVKEKFRKLNESSKTITEVDAEIAALRKANEKLAITKFQQNLRNDSVRVLVAAANKQTLDENVQFALEREILLKTSNLKECGYCNKKNHTEDQCRAKIDANKKSPDSNKKPPYKLGESSSKSFDKNNFPPKREDQKPNGNGISKNNNSNNNNNKNNLQRFQNRGNNIRNVKAVESKEKSENPPEEIKLENVKLSQILSIKESNVSKN